jgi:synaptic vesicle membrane protein VAT-1
MKIFGQELSVVRNQINALFMNLLSWLLQYIPKQFRSVSSSRAPQNHEDSCVCIDGPGGIDRLQVVSLQKVQIKKVSRNSFGRIATVGYNVEGYPAPFAALPTEMDSLPADLVLVKVHYFSVNYADVTIRWGLYESALRYVGWPIVPGFDVSGEVEWAGRDTGFTAGDKVFGFTLFGAYSSSLLVPGRQIRKIPLALGSTKPALTLESAAALPAVAATALHAISQAGGWPVAIATVNKAALVHSAAGGVGGMLIQMLKELGYHPIVGVVGSSHKVQFCKSLGADHVIDKSSTNLWKEAKKYSLDGYVAIFDANGVDTLSDSYDNLCRCGRLVTYGFHSNLPKASSFLSPIEWIRMIYRVIVMPKFDPMSLVLDSKAVLGFNLSFFADEKELVRKYFEQIYVWVEEGKISIPACTVCDMNDVGRAHELIQTGATVGKIVMRVSVNAGRM